MKLARQITETCFSILGSSTYLEENRHNKIANDLQAFNWWEGTDDMLAFHITVSGIAHVSESVQVIHIMIMHEIRAYQQLHEKV